MAAGDGILGQRRAGRQDIGKVQGFSERRKSCGNDEIGAAGGLAIVVSRKDFNIKIKIFSRIEPQIEPCRRRCKENGQLDFYTQLAGSVKNGGEGDL